jgi:hypothetical protein
VSLGLQVTSASANVTSGGLACTHVRFRGKADVAAIQAPFSVLV